MNLKAFIGVFAVALLVLAAVPGGSYAMVEDTYNEVMKPYGYDPDRHHQTIEEAKEKTIEALKAKPDSELTPEQAHWLGGHYAHSFEENPEKAEHYYKLAVEKDPDYAEGHLSLASFYHQQGKYQNALRHLDASIMLNPDGMYEVTDSQTTAVVQTRDGPVKMEDLGGSYSYSELADTLREMDKRGYDVGNLPERFDEIVESGQYENLKTKQDLRKIGYMKVREEKLKPLMEEENKPLSVKVSEAVTKDPHQKELVQYFFLPIVAGAVMVVMIFGYIGVKVGKRVFGRGSRR